MGQCLENKDPESPNTWRFETLPLEHMPEVTPTSGTGDLGALHSQRTVHVARYGAWDGWHDGAQFIAVRHVQFSSSYYRQKRLASRRRCRT